MMIASGRLRPANLLVLLFAIYLEDIACEEEVLLPVNKHPRPYPDVNMPRIQDQDIEEAFRVAKSREGKRQEMEKNLARENGILSDNEISAQARHQKNNVLMPQSRQIDTHQETFQQASAYLKDSYRLTNEQATYGLSRIDTSGSRSANDAQRQCRSMFRVSCPRDDAYRTADGSCNNVNNPTWGKSFTCFARLVPPVYADGISSPRISETGEQLPNPRLISLNVHNDLNVQSDSYTHMTMQWGQFLDHDMTITPMNRAGPNMDMIECCRTSGTPHPECFPISLSRNDPFYSQFRETCMNFVRSASCTSDCTLGPRQHTNQLTAFIDGSNIYGSTQNDSNLLRTFRGGLLKYQSTRVGELLPESRDPENDQCSNQGTNQDICFQAGDERVNEQPGLTAMHTLWLRQHNRIARNFGRRFPNAPDELIFQETRKIVGAQLQMITYNEFLPVVLGDAYMKNYHLSPLTSGYTNYDSQTQPSIVTEFSTAAYRFGHTLIQNQFAHVGDNGVTGFNLKDNYFFPSAYQGSVEPLLQGLFRQRAQLFDRHIVEAVTNHLYKQRDKPFGMDLPALNIQRSRDHGIPGYTTYLDYCFDIKIRSFEDLLQVMTEKNAILLANTYNIPSDIDLFTGGVAETSLPGAVVGPTFGCIIGMQFYHLKFGDRHFFEHGDQGGSFKRGQLYEIRQTTLANIICMNTNKKISHVQAFAFQPYNSNFNGAIDCSRPRDIDYEQWSN